MLVIDAQTGRDAGALEHRAVTLPLRGRVEDHVIGERDELAHLAIGVGRGVGMDLATELFARESCFGHG